MFEWPAHEMYSMSDYERHFTFIWHLIGRQIPFNNPRICQDLPVKRWMHWNISSQCCNCNRRSPVFGGLTADQLFFFFFLSVASYILLSNTKNSTGKLQNALWKFLVRDRCTQTHPTTTVIHGTDVRTWICFFGLGNLTCAHVIWVVRNKVTRTHSILKFRPPSRLDYRTHHCSQS
jgi:hypothetical protein